MEGSGRDKKGIAGGKWCWEEGEKRGKKGSHSERGKLCVKGREWRRQAEKTWRFVGRERERERERERQEEDGRGVRRGDQKKII